jgi:hypothetical protein
VIGAQGYMLEMAGYQKKNLDREIETNRNLIVTTQATCSKVAGMNGLPDKAS